MPDRREKDLTEVINRFRKIVEATKEAAEKLKRSPEEASPRSSGEAGEVSSEKAGG